MKMMYYNIKYSQVCVGRDRKKIILSFCSPLQKQDIAFGCIEVLWNQIQPMMAAIRKCFGDMPNSAIQRDQN